MTVAREIKLEFGGHVPADKLGTGGWAVVVTPLGTARIVIAVIPQPFVGRGLAPAEMYRKQQCRINAPSFRPPLSLRGGRQPDVGPKGMPVVQSPASIYRKLTHFQAFHREIATDLSALAMTSFFQQAATIQHPYKLKFVILTCENRKALRLPVSCFED